MACACAYVNSVRPARRRTRRVRPSGLATPPPSATRSGEQRRDAGRPVHPPHVAGGRGRPGDPRRVRWRRPRRAGTARHTSAAARFPPARRACVERTVMLTRLCSVGCPTIGRDSTREGDSQFGLSEFQIRKSETRSRPTFDG